jgi:hypothetical protein
MPRRLADYLLCARVGGWLLGLACASVWFVAWLCVRAGELVAWLCVRIGKLDSSRASRCKNTPKTRAKLGCLIGWFLYRAPVVVFFIETDPTRHIVLCLD